MNLPSSKQNAIHMFGKLDTLKCYFLQPRTSNPKDIFREKTIRYVTIVATLAFILLGIYSSLDGISLQSKLWYGTIMLFSIVIFYFLHHGQIQSAVLAFTASMILILLDNTASYWSPGTLAFNIMYSLVFHIIHEDTRDRTVAVILNMGIFLVITLINLDSSPLASSDYYSSPVSAVGMTIAINIIIYGIAHNIRQEQYQRDQIDLLLEQQQTDVLRQFLGNSSHDLRTILSRVRMKLYLIRRNEVVKSSKHIDALETNINQLETSLLAMIEMSRLDDKLDLDSSEIDVNHLVERLFSQYMEIANQQGINLAYSPPQEDFLIRGDEALIQRAIENVLKNALDFTYDGGQIELAVAKVRNNVCISITDTGIGITEDHMPHIFDRFFRGDKARQNPDGRVGLGLAMARKIIELHQGTITAQSEVEKGSTFTITFPLSK